MGRGRIPWILSVFLSAIGIAWSVEISFENSHDGYFLKSTYGKQNAYNPHLSRETFIITQAQDSHLMRVKYGPFDVYQTVPQILLDSNIDNENTTRSFDHRVIFNNYFSVHVIEWPKDSTQSKLQVLVHASPNHDGRRQSVVFDYYMPDQRWCVQVYARLLSSEISEVCVLSQKDNACVVNLSIPADWWSLGLDATDVNNSSSITVFYSLNRVDQSYRCAGVSNSIVPVRAFDHSNFNNQKYFLTHLSLESPADNILTEERQDNDVVLYIPKNTFHVGSTFSVPVKLEANSELKIFIIRARARSGLSVIGAEVAPDSGWEIHLDQNQRQHTATVTAFVKNGHQHSVSESRMLVFTWEFEVVDDTDEKADNGRIVWTIEHGFINGPKQDQYFVPMARIVSKIDIDSSSAEKILPVLKVEEVINDAILTGKELAYPMSIYTISKEGDLKDVTDRTMCYSSDHGILKVSSSCRKVYLDGTERRGSHNATIIAKYGHHMAQVSLRVWVPEDRLVIQLSDNKLSQIKQWRAPRGRKLKSRHKRSGLPYHAQSPRKRMKCQLRFQQALLDVYTRFIISTPDGETDYFNGNKAYYRITDLVQNRIRVSDPRIAELQGHVISGQQLGRTEIQILSPTGSVIAAKEVRVGKDKVALDTLLVSMVTGISLEIKESAMIPGALTANAHIHDQLQGKYQEGVMNVMLKFSDGTTFPLKYVRPDDYYLDMTTLNHHIIRISPYVSYSQPRVVAIGDGNGDIVKAVLRLGDACYKKKSQPLSQAHVYVNVDLTSDKSGTEHFQSDAVYNRANDRWNSGAGLSDRKRYHNVKYGGKKTDPEFHSETKQSGEIQSDAVFAYSTMVIPLNGKDSSGSPTTSPRMEAQQQALNAGMSPLEVGMYVLLAIFCLAIMVFIVNCVVFAVRYRRKRVPKENQEVVTNANDWVWIGRATLERSAVLDTHCSQALLLNPDFNGNHMDQRRRTDSGSNPSSRSTSRPTSGVEITDDTITSSACSSNRNSSVSMYKGSECSIRITTNPLMDGANATEMTTFMPNNSTGHRLPEHIYTNSTTQRNRQHGLSGEYSMASVPQRSHSAPRYPHTMNNNYNNNLNDNYRYRVGTIQSVDTDPEWDYEAMGLSYDQLLDYFDNLKESTA